MALLVKFTTIVFAATAFVQGADWDYVSPSRWPQLHMDNMCGSAAQSPVGVTYGDALYNNQLQPVQFSVTAGATETVVTPTQPIVVPGSLQNDGHKISFVVNDSMQIYLRFGESDSYRYRVYHIHWHWGSVDSKGSEHTLNGAAYVMESHMVTFNETLYQNFTNAAGKPGGLAVYGLFYELVSADKSLAAVDQLAASLDASMNQKTSTNNATKSLNLTMFDLFHGRTKHYYRYMGSLTTPPCTENVLWNVAKVPVPITAAQLAKFRALKNADGTAMVDNFRPTLLLNPARPDAAQRTVTRSWSGGPASVKASAAQSYFVLVVALVFGVISR